MNKTSNFVKTIKISLDSKLMLELDNKRFQKFKCILRKIWENRKCCDQLTIVCTNQFKYKKNTKYEKISIVLLKH